MDNQKNSNFFTAGVGDNQSVDFSGTKDPNNLNSDNWVPAEIKSINEEIISQDPSPESPGRSDEMLEVTLPPNVTNTPSGTKTEASDHDPLPDLDFSRIRTDGDRLAKGALTTAQQAENRLIATGNASDFYGAVRSAMQANLKNSYDREPPK